MIIDLEKFERLGNAAIAKAQWENEIYKKRLIPFAKKIGLYKKSKTFEEAANKAIKFAKEKAKYRIN